MIALLLIAGTLAAQDDLPFSVQQFMRGHELRRVELKNVALAGKPALHLIARTYGYPRSGPGTAQGGHLGGASTRPQREKEPPTLVETSQVFVVPEPAPRTEPSKLPWLQVAPAQHEVTLPLGVADGRRWFGRMSVAQACSIASWVGLEPSPELDRAAIQALWIEDDGMNSRNSAAPYITKFGDRLVPELIRAMNASATPEKGIHALAYLRTDDATRALVEYSSHADPLGEEARRALLVGDPRPKGKAAYLDMLRRSPSVGAAKAAAALHWSEALPDIRRHLLETKRPYQVLDFLLAERTLSGRPLPPNALKAHERLGQVDDVQRGLHYDPQDDEAILASLPDKEALSWLAYALYAKVSKAEVERANASGLGLLKHLPKDEARRLVDRLEVMDTTERKHASDLTRLLAL